MKDIPADIAAKFEEDEFRMGFGPYFKRLHATSGRRGLFLTLARRPTTDAVHIRLYSVGPTGEGRPRWPTSLQEFVGLLQVQKVNANVMRAGVKVWEDFRISTMTPEERTLARAKRVGENAERWYLRRLDAALETRRRLSKERDKVVQARVLEWGALGAKALDEPVPLRRLLPYDRAQEIDPSVMAIRNQVSGREFLHEVLALPDLNIRSERLVVAATLEAIPGWTREEGIKRHRGSLQIVFRRDGTDGRPTVVADNATPEDNEPEPPRSTRRRIM